MKKIVLFVCTFLCFFSCIYSQHTIKPKTVYVPPVKKPPTKPVVPPKPKSVTGWYLNFLVRIKGIGLASDINGFDDFSWIIDRSYTGTVLLDKSNPGFDPAWSQSEMRDALLSDRKTEWSQDPLKPPRLAYVSMHDILRTRVKEKDEGSTFENTTIDTRWDADNEIYANNASLVLDKKLGTYNVVISFSCKNSTNGCQQKIRIDTSIERSDHGYGDLPTSYFSGKVKTILFSNIRLPAIRGLLENSTIHHEFDLPLPQMKEGKYQFSPVDKEPDEPMIVDIPESKTKVKIHIAYDFAPLYTKQH